MDHLVTGIIMLAGGVLVIGISDLLRELQKATRLALVLGGMFAFVAINISTSVDAAPPTSEPGAGAASCKYPSPASQMPGLNAWDHCYIRPESRLCLHLLDMAIEAQVACNQ